MSNFSEEGRKLCDKILELLEEEIPTYKRGNNTEKKEEIVSGILDQIDSKDFCTEKQLDLLRKIEGEVNEMLE